MNDTIIDALARHPGVGLALATFLYGFIVICGAAAKEVAEHAVVRYWAARLTAETCADEQRRKIALADTQKVTE